MNTPATYTPKQFAPGDKVTAIDIQGIGIVRKVHKSLLWIDFPSGLEVVLYLNAQKAA